MASEINCRFAVLFTGSRISQLKRRSSSPNSFFGSQQILAVVLICCSQCFNPLRRANNEVEKTVWKKRARSEDTYGLLLD